MSDKTYILYLNNNLYAVGNLQYMRELINKWIDREFYGSDRAMFEVVEVIDNANESLESLESEGVEMRIDKENEVVWCSESEISWYNSFVLNGGRDNSFANLRRINALSTEKEVVLPSYMTVTDRVELIRAISNNFEFKLEQPQKYYWRKKKEHFAGFEDGTQAYIVRFKFSDSDEYKYCLDDVDSALKFTEQEARDILKNDFDKFEKVECE